MRRGHQHGRLRDDDTLSAVSSQVHAGLFITILAWRPQAGSQTVLYSIAVIWGLSDSVWIVQINGKEEAAFSNFRLWESVGYIIAYVISPYLRTSSKTYLMATMMVTGMVCYFIVEFRDRSAKKLVELKKKELVYGNGCDNIAFHNVE
ncbi:hypothetical protein OBRU01_00553 [Operophtera brumata]|uniref:Uncharacterized protein n=1 Tax=Operophtera brumata TaxID=104452 RepID=A0A0L7LV56_OPEBR|nr:hypothetical protein OBRU01_00553 [Operophtera brumata]